MKKHAGTTTTIVGTILRGKVAGGSKSEHSGFFIVWDSGDSKRVLIKGENPFEQPTLKSFVGKRCVVEGRVREGDDVLLVETIKQVKRKS